MFAEHADRPWNERAARQFRPPSTRFYAGHRSIAPLLTVAVPIRQNRTAELAAHRAHLDLQINLLTEQKVSKVIELLGSLMASHPDAATNSAQGVDALAEPTDPEALLDAIRQSDKPKVL